MTSSNAIQTGLKDVMRIFPQGVTVVAIKAPGGPRGLTVSAFISVSLDPPLALVSISKTSTVYSLLMQAKEFAINFLANDQESFSDRFAGRHEIKYDFEGIAYSPGTTGSPIIRGVRAVIECRRRNVYEGGDHSLIIGEVVRAEKLNDKPPLVYYDQQYTTTSGRNRAVRQVEMKLRQVSQIPHDSSGPAAASDPHSNLWARVSKPH